MDLRWGMQHHESIVMMWMRRNGGAGPETLVEHEASVTDLDLVAVNLTCTRRLFVAQPQFVAPFSISAELNVQPLLPHLSNAPSQSCQAFHRMTANRSF
jgi:hypothetical protein